MQPTWTDGLRKLYCGDSLAILPTLPPQSFSAVLTDPPYGAGILARGDDSPAEAAVLLRQTLKLCVPLLEPAAHAAVFWGSIGLDLAIAAAKKSGFGYSHLLPMHVPGNSRPTSLGYLLHTQYILILRLPGRRIPAWRVAAAKTITAAMEAQNLSRYKLAKLLGCSERLVMKWTREDDETWSYPNFERREKLREILGITLPVALAPAQPKVRDDLFRVAGQPATNHPCEKPLGVITDLASRLGSNILDPFAGSGTTLEAAKTLGIGCTGIEIDWDYCRRAVERMRQRRLEFA